MRLSFIAAIGALLIVVLSDGPLSAHEGHDHGDKPAAPQAKAAARAGAVSDQYELVAVMRGLNLEIFLDRFATNEPVEGAVIEVETPAGPAKAKAEPGQPYRARRHRGWRSPARVELIGHRHRREGCDRHPARSRLDGARPRTADRRRAATPITRRAPAHVSRSRPVLLALAARAFIAGLGAMLTAFVRRSRAEAAALLSRPWSIHHAVSLRPAPAARP